MTRLKKDERALEGGAAVGNRVTYFISVSGSILYVHVYHPRGALPVSGLARCPINHGE
jgi:hypothetical protein